MAAEEPGSVLKCLCSRIQDCVAPYAGRVEYGNLRSRITEWDRGDGQGVTNVALVYETPGGSTDQINISYDHATETFALVDEHIGEVTTGSVDDVVASIRPRITGIPLKRLETLFAEIRRQVDGGTNTHVGLFGHLNRVMQSEFKGGKITHVEFKEAMTFAVNYLKNGKTP